MGAVSSLKLEMHSLANAAHQVQPGDVSVSLMLYIPRSGFMLSSVIRLPLESLAGSSQSCLPLSHTALKATQRRLDPQTPCD